MGQGLKSLVRIESDMDYRLRRNCKVNFATVIIGPPTAPLTRSLALDLERRGFIVYVVVNAVEDEQLVHNESRVDIRPLLLDIGNV